MSWTLFLDDERHPPLSSAIKYDHIARSYEEAIKLVEERGIPTFIAFDHDLGIGPTGYDFAKWLVVQDLDDRHKFPNNFAYSVHSENCVGARNIIGLLESYLKF